MENDDLWEKYLNEAFRKFVDLPGVSDKTKAKIPWDDWARLYPLAAGR